MNYWDSNMILKKSLIINEGVIRTSNAASEIFTLIIIYIFNCSNHKNVLETVNSI